MAQKSRWEVTLHASVRNLGVIKKKNKPYYPWQNSAEGGLIKLKIGAGRKMFKAGSTKRLWDDCL